MRSEPEVFCIFRLAPYNVKLLLVWLMDCFAIQVRAHRRAYDAMNLLHLGAVFVMLKFVQARFKRWSQPYMIDTVAGQIEISIRSGQPHFQVSVSGWLNLQCNVSGQPHSYVQLTLSLSRMYTEPAGNRFACRHCSAGG